MDQLKTLREGVVLAGENCGNREDEISVGPTDPITQFLNPDSRDDDLAIQRTIDVALCVKGIEGIAIVWRQRKSFADAQWKVGI